MFDLVAYALGLAMAQAPAVPPPKPGGGGPQKARSPEEVQRLIARLPTMPEDERRKAVEALSQQFGGLDSNPVVPGADTDLVRYLALPARDQVQVAARGFMHDLIAGDTARLVARSGLPFLLESRRVERADDLKTEWSLALRSRRADLLQLYSIEALTPAEMEHRHGKAPARLAAWNLKAPNTWLALVNASGHAVVLMLRQAGAAWQVVGFHD